MHGQLTLALADLRVSTPRLTLRHISDELAVELAHLAAAGIHDPATQPFSEPWTDVPSPELERNTLRHFWRCRAEATPVHWDLCLAVTTDETAVGVCTVHGENFATRRSVTTGSWLGRRYHRRGLGTEMRHAALHLIFDGFGARRAVTRVWHDNIPSLGVTRSLPYVHTATTREQRRDQADTMLEFSMSREQWETVRRNDIQLSGIREVRSQLRIDYHRETPRPGRSASSGPHIDTP